MVLGIMLDSLNHVLLGKRSNVSEDVMWLEKKE